MITTNIAAMPATTSNAPVSYMVTPEGNVISHSEFAHGVL